MGKNPLVKAFGAGTVLQVLMVLVGHFAPGLQTSLFPIGGTAIGLITGWLAGKGLPGAALGDVPMNNAGIAGGSTLVAGALGGILTHFLGKKSA